MIAPYSAPLHKVTVEAINEQTVLLTWPEVICPKQHHEIMQCKQQITIKFASLIIETIASYNSLIIYYHFNKITAAKLCEQLQAVINNVALSTNNAKANLPQQDSIEIPVYYGDKAAWDIKNVASRCSMSIEQVISLHSQTLYRAYALGFTPGFCYLGSVDEKLQLPRRSSPRIKVPKGAVAIAEQQTAVYPNESPGGWHIIGQTPIDIYQVHNNEFMPKINVGDTIKFTAIDYQEFCQLGGVLSVVESLE